MLCAGRDPSEAELAAIQKADAVILPQGCRQSLYEMAKKNCSRVFPDYDTRFRYSGKIGQAKLFKIKSAPFPKTRIFSCLEKLTLRQDPAQPLAGFDFPFVFKFDWGGEGDHVLLIDTPKKFLQTLEQAKAYEQTGQRGFLIQAYIPCGNRSLRVVVIGETLISYWRVQIDPSRFVAGVSKGAKVNKRMAPNLQKRGRDLVNSFCRDTGINLAGFDLIFSDPAENSAPFFLEINWFFGRSGLGGSKRFYRLLNAEIKKWLDSKKTR
jgi:ribosomal protein S6--L-glutamate ligase